MSGLSASEASVLEADRRSGVLLAWLGAIVAASGILVAITLTMLLSRELPGDLLQPIEIGPASAYLGQEGRPLLVSNKRAWVVEVEGGLIALVNRSPHAGCRVDWKPDQGRFIDPCHGQIHRLDGSYDRGPTVRDMRRYPILALDAERQIVARTNAAGDPLQVPPESLLYLDLDEAAELDPVSSRSAGATDRP